MPRIKSPGAGQNVAIAHIREFALAKYLGAADGQISQEVSRSPARVGRARGAAEVPAAPRRRRRLTPNARTPQQP